MYGSSVPGLYRPLEQIATCECLRQERELSQPWLRLRHERAVPRRQTIQELSKARKFAEWVNVDETSPGMRGTIAHQSAISSTGSINMLLIIGYFGYGGP
jgi:hypothetical protein